MAQLSRRYLVTSFAALAGCGVAGHADAQPPGPGPRVGRGPGWKGGPGVMGHGMGMGRHFFGDQAAYLAGVQTELGITPEQEPAWKTYVAAMDAASAQIQSLRQTMWDAMGTATWEERRDMMNRTFQARQQAFQAANDAARALMPALSERQQGKAEIILPGLGWYGRHRRREM